MPRNQPFIALPTLEEWQSFDDECKPRRIVLNRAVLADILLASDSPWGYMASLSQQELAGYLEEKEAEGRGEILSRPPRRQGVKTYRSKNLSSPATETLKKPFPLGPAPDLMRMNPVSGQRELVVAQDMVTKAYTFHSPLNTTNLSTKEWRAPSPVPKVAAMPLSLTTALLPLLDRSYAQILLRLHPTLFLTLYEHEKKYGRLGTFCPFENTDVRGPATQSRPLNANEQSLNQQPVQRRKNIVLGGVELCSRALLSALAHSHMNGQYQRLTMEEILCNMPLCVCQQGSSEHRENNVYCTRHCIFLSWEEIVEREERYLVANLEQRFMAVQPAYKTSNSILDQNEFKANTEDLQGSLITSSQIKSLYNFSACNNKSPDTMHTISTISTTGSSDLISGKHARGKKKSMATIQQTLQDQKDGLVVSHYGHFHYRKNLVDSSSSHPLRAPYRPSEAGCSVSHSSSLVSRPKTFWPDCSRQQPPIKQLDTTLKLVEPVALRAVSSGSPDFRLVSLTKSTSIARIPVPNKERNQHEKSSRADPEMMDQLQWISSGKALPVSNRMGNRRLGKHVGDDQATSDPKILDIVHKIGAGRRKTSTSRENYYPLTSTDFSVMTINDVFPVEGGLMRQDTEASTIKSMSDDGAVPEDDEEAGISALPFSGQVSFMRQIVVHPGESIQSCSNSAYSMFNGVDNVKTECSSPVSVTTIDLRSFD